MAPWHLHLCTTGIMFSFWFNDGFSNFYVLTVKSLTHSQWSHPLIHSELTPSFTVNSLTHSQWTHSLIHSELIHSFTVNSPIHMSATGVKHFWLQLSISMSLGLPLSPLGLPSLTLHLPSQSMPGATGLILSSQFHVPVATRLSHRCHCMTFHSCVCSNADNISVVPFLFQWIYTSPT